MADQFIPPRGIFQPKSSQMSVWIDLKPEDVDDRGYRFVDLMERLFGRTRAARMIGVAPGTLENISKRRRKNLPARVYEQIRGGLIRGLESEIRKLESELAIARQSGLGENDDDFLAAAASLENAKSLIKGAAR